jgi:protein HIRA/HIR1
MLFISSNATNERNWTSHVCGLSKKDLLREVLGIFGKTQSLGEIAQVWQDRLKASLRES